MHTSSKAISEGAMMLALLGVALLLNQQWASMFELMFFFLSVPIVVYTLKYGGRMSFVLCISSLILALMLATPTSVFYVGMALSLGVVYAMGMRRGFSNRALLGLSVVSNLVSMYITTLLVGALFGYNIHQEVQDILSYLPTQRGDDEWVRTLVEQCVLLSYVGLALLQAVVVHLMVHQVCKRCHYEVSALKSVYALSFPRWLAPCIVVIGVLNASMVYVSVSPHLHSIIVGLYIIGLSVGVCAGVLYILCFLQRKKVKRRYIFITIFACLIPLIQNVIAFVGVLDIWFGLRNKMREGGLYEIH